MKKSVVFVITIVLILISCWEYTTPPLENAGGNERPVNPFLGISEKGINYPGCVWPNMPRVGEEPPTIYWCTVGYNYSYLFEDFWAMKKMGVKHIRLRAEIFPFMEWDENDGYLGFKQAYINNLKEVLELADSLEFKITLCMMSGVDTDKHPSFKSFMESFDYIKRIMDGDGDEKPLHPGRLKSIHTAFYYFILLLKHYESIFSWEIINEANYFSDDRGLNWEYCVREIFMPIRSNIRTADSSRPVLISFCGLRNNNHQKPEYIKNRYSRICDYYDGHYYWNNTANLPDLNTLDKPVVLGEVGCHGDIKPSPLFHPDRAANVRVLKMIWNVFKERGYRSFMPWDFNSFVQMETGGAGTEKRHCWRWDALLLYSLYTDDTVDFISSNYYVSMITEPSFEGEYIFFNVFVPDVLEKYNVPPPEIIINTIRTLHPFYGKPIRQGLDGQILNTYFPPVCAVDKNGDNTIAIPDEGTFYGCFKTSIYGSMQCSELPVTVTANTVTTLDFTDYSTKMEMIARTDMEITEAIDGGMDDQSKWITMTICNYPRTGGPDRFGIEALKTYRITSKDLDSPAQQSWSVQANPDGTLMVTIPLFCANQQVTIEKEATGAID